MFDSLKNPKKAVRNYASYTKGFKKLSVAAIIALSVLRSMMFLLDNAMGLINLTDLTKYLIFGGPMTDMGGHTTPTWP